MTTDRRITPARRDIAAAALTGKVKADKFVDPVACMVRSDRAPMRSAPDTEKPFDTVLIYGEPFDVYEQTDDGWAWGQSGLDDYVGYVPAAALRPMPRQPRTHRIDTLGTQLYRQPELKSAPAGTLPFSARVVVTQQGDEFSQLGNGLWVPNPHLRPLDDPRPNWVAVAEQFLGVPYVWGGRSSAGLDCSALVQLARQAAGHECPRDSDMQEAALGETLPEDAALTPGDLIFWKGHVGIISSDGTLLHANAYHMAVAQEPLDQAIERIAANSFGAVTRRARL